MKGLKNNFIRAFNRLWPGFEYQLATKAILALAPMPASGMNTPALPAHRLGAERGDLDRVLEEILGW